MFDFIPRDFLYFIPMYWNIPWTHLWIWQFFNLAFFIWFFVCLYIFDKQKKYYARWLIKKHCVYMLDWKTWSWKTRLLTQIARDVKDKHTETIIISNFFCEYIDLYFSSIQDFKLLQIDIARLWEYLNFDDKEKKEIEKYFPWYFRIVDDELNKKVKKIKWKYDILTLWDEFYAYFHNRNFMSNFSTKNWWDELLLNLHQTRHSNQTIILASQDDDNIDLDFRQIAHNEINVFSFFLDLFFWFNKFTYLSKKQIKKLWIEFKQSNFIPYIFLNYYELNKKINSFLSFCYWTYNFIFCKSLFLENINFIKIKQLLFIEKIYFAKKILKYNTKFNVKKSINVYQPWLIYDFLIKKEKSL